MCVEVRDVLEKWMRYSMAGPAGCRYSYQSLMSSTWHARGPSGNLLRSPGWWLVYEAQKRPLSSSSKHDSEKFQKGMELCNTPCRRTDLTIHRCNSSLPTRAKSAETQYGKAETRFRIIRHTGLNMFSNLVRFQHSYRSRIPAWRLVRPFRAAPARRMVEAKSDNGSKTGETSSQTHIGKGEGGTEPRHEPMTDEQVMSLWAVGLGLFLVLSGCYAFAALLDALRCKYDKDQMRETVREVFKEELSKTTVEIEAGVASEPSRGTGAP